MPRSCSVVLFVAAAVVVVVVVAAAAVLVAVLVAIVAAAAFASVHCFPSVQGGSRVRRGLDRMRARILLLQHLLQRAVLQPAQVQPGATLHLQPRSAVAQLRRRVAAEQPGICKGKGRQTWLPAGIF